MTLVPQNKNDIQAVFNLNNATDISLKPHIPELLECLQDMNWPIALPVCERLAHLGEELILPIIRVLQGKDEMWKYWIVTLLLYSVNDEVLKGLSFTLKSMKLNPTRDEREHCVHGAVCCLLLDREIERPLVEVCLPVNLANLGG